MAKDEIIVTEQDKLRLADVKDQLIKTFTLYRRRAGRPGYVVKDKYTNHFYKVAKIIEALDLTPEEYISACFEQYQPECFVPMILKPPPLVKSGEFSQMQRDRLKSEVTGFIELLKQSLAAENSIPDTLENPLFSFSVVFKYLIYSAYNDPAAAIYERKAKSYLDNQAYQDAYADLIDMANKASKEIT